MSCFFFPMVSSLHLSLFLQMSYIGGGAGQWDFEWSLTRIERILVFLP